jgi:SAM-dependent methyltransferase
VGCGTGSFAASLGRSGARVVAVDLRPEGLRRLRDLAAPVWVAIARTEALPVADRSADTALALDVLEHVDDTRSLIEIARVLKPGGIVVITVPAMPWLWSARDDEAGHLRRYTKRSLLALVRRAGLEPVEIHFYQCLLLPLLLVTRAAGRLWSRTQRVEEQPAGWLNRLCLAVSRAEVRLGAFVAWPIGSSLAAVARKPA